jgi:hypothetical protein
VGLLSRRFGAIVSAALALALALATPHCGRFHQRLFHSCASQQQQAQA